VGETTYSINAPDVIAETIDGETMLVNLATGSYYNLEGSGAEVWSLLMEGATPRQISEELAARFIGEKEEIEGAVARLVDELRAEQILVESLPTAARPATPPPAEAAARRPFAAPKLAKFTDMQDIILLDPVHEVDARGWPHQAQDVSASAGS
jgi:hypothetical protein